MKLTIGKKFGGIIVIVSVLMSFSVLINWIYGRKSNDLAERSRKESVVFAIKAKDMQIAVIQVQQWLTDISATRAAEGFDDGFKEAENQVAIFKKHYDDFNKMFMRENDKKAIEDLGRLNKDFDAFYNMGKKMANIYISEGPAEGNQMMEKFDPFAEAISNAIGTFAESQINELNESMKEIVSTISSKNQIINLLISTAILAILIALIYFITSGIRKNVGKILEFVGLIAKGDFTSSIEMKSQDEIGHIADQLNEMRLQVRNMLQDVIKGNETLFSSSTELSTISQQLAAGSEQTSAKSNTVATAAEEMSSNINAVAAATEEASTNVNMVAASTEEMTATINEIAQNAEKARTIADNAVTQAKSASEKVEYLGNASQDIGKVTEAIAEISEQTDLLALNATIEAARSGEAGKGFAVVANEIKELARQTAEATQDIKNKIQGIQGSTSEAVTQVMEISKVINDVNDIVSTIATAVEEQSVTTQEIARNLAQASQGIQEVNQNVNQSSSVAGEITKDIQEVNQASNEMSNGTAQVNASAAELSRLAEKLKEMMSRFKI